MSGEPIRLRRHTDGRVAIKPPKIPFHVTHWAVFENGTPGKGWVCDEAVTGPGWFELLVAELPEPDYIGEVSTPNWVTSDGTRIKAHASGLTVDHHDQHDVELITIDTLKMLAAVSAHELLRKDQR